MFNLDKGLLFGNPSTGESVPVENFVNNNTTINVNGCAFSHGNIDRNRTHGYAVPRSYPTADEYPHYIGSEGFWHPANDAAKAATRKAYKCE